MSIIEIIIEIDIINKYTIQISNPECSNYNELSDATRKGTYGKGNRCDVLGHINASADWKGPSWYRVVGQAGTKLLSADPGYQHCNTDDAGILYFKEALAFQGGDQMSKSPKMVSEGAKLGQQVSFIP